MSDALKNNPTPNAIGFSLVNKSTGAAITADAEVWVKTASSEAAGQGSMVHSSNIDGQWYYTPTQAETNYDWAVFTAVDTARTATPQPVTIYFTPKRLRDLQDPTVSAIQSGLMTSDNADLAAIKAKTDLLGFTGSLVNATVSGVATSANQSTMQASLTAIQAITDQFTFTDGLVDANATVEGDVATLANQTTMLSNLATLLSRTTTSSITVTSPLTIDATTGDATLELVQGDSYLDEDGNPITLDVSSSRLPDTLPDNTEVEMILKEEASAATVAVDGEVTADGATKSLSFDMTKAVSSALAPGTKNHDLSIRFILGGDETKVVTVLYGKATTINNLKVIPDPS